VLDDKGSSAYVVLAICVGSGREMLLTEMGYAYKNLGDLISSIRAYEEAVLAKPDHSDAWNNMAVTMLLLGCDVRDLIPEEIRVEPAILLASLAHDHLIDEETIYRVGQLLRELYEETKRVGPEPVTSLVEELVHRTGRHAETICKNLIRIARSEGLPIDIVLDELCRRKLSHGDF